nr:hypothetical protein [Phycicoccus jejuensis]
MARLDEAVRVPVEGVGHRPAGDVLDEVLDEDLDREVRDRPRLARRDVARVAEGEDVVVPVREEGVLVDRHVVELVAEPRRADEVRAHVERHGDELVVGDLPLVEGDDDLPLLVDPLDHEVGLDGDALLLEQAPERPARDGLRERAVERGDEDELVPGQDAAVLEAHLVGVGVDPLDRPHDDVDAVVDEGAPGPADLLGGGDAEGDEQVARLVVVDVVAVDDGDGPRLAGQPLAQLVDDHRPGGPGAEDQQVLLGSGHGSLLLVVVVAVYPVGYVRV